eukprot:m.234021 g.234021  ORF g.234021 m.234021 type:complete len:318 (+) comp12603_c0_seq1:1766-2719(+)
MITCDRLRSLLPTQMQSTSTVDAVARAEEMHERLMRVRAHSEVFFSFHPSLHPDEVMRRVKAATRIQALWRGYRTRKVVNLQTQLALKSRGLNPGAVMESYRSTLKDVAADFKRAGMDFTVAPPAFADLAKFERRIDELKNVFEEHTALAPSGLDLEHGGKALRAAQIYPTRAELVDAITTVTERTAKAVETGKVRLDESQFVRVAFHLKEPAGMAVVRAAQSSWLHPRINGQEATALMQDIKNDTPLAKVMEVVVQAAAERRARDPALSPRNLGGPLLPPRPLPRPVSPRPGGNNLMVPGGSSGGSSPRPVSPRIA